MINGKRFEIEWSWPVIKYVWKDTKPLNTQPGHVNISADMRAWYLQNVSQVYINTLYSGKCRFRRNMQIALS